MLVRPGAVHVHEAVVALSHHVVVEDLVAIGTVQEHGQVHILVPEGVRPAEGELRKRGPDAGLVVLVDDVVTVDILELDIADPDGGGPVEHTVSRIFLRLRGILDVLQGLVHAFHDIAVEVVQGLADLGHGNDVAPLAVAHELCVGGTVQGDELVPVEGNLEIAVPAEVLLVDRMRVQGDFQTLVLDGAEIALRRREGGGTVALRTHVGREGQGHQHVGRDLLIEVHRQVDAVLQEVQVETEVRLHLLLPVDTGVGNVRRTLAVAEAGRHLAHAGLPGAAADVGVTRLAPAHADLTVVQADGVGEILQESLVGEAPGSREGMEIRPPVIRTEVGGTVPTEGVGRQVAVVIVVGLTGEEGRHRGGAETGAHGRVAGGERNVVDIIRRKTGVAGAEVVPAGLPGFLAHHGRQAVLAEGIGIGQVVLEGPVGAGVALGAHGVVAALPAAEVHHRLIGRGLGVGDVETDLAAPGEMLEGRDVRIDVAGEFLALEEVLVQHGQGHRVGGGITLTDRRGIVAIQVIDRDVRQRAQGVEDDTFLTIGELDIVVGDGVSGVHAQLEPVLELRIHVGAEGETVEVGTDDGTLLVHVGTGNVVLHLLGAALGADLVLVLQGGAEHLVLPVGTLAEDGGIGIVAVVVHKTLTGEVVVVFGELTEVHHVDAAVLAGDREHAVIGELRIAGLAVLGGDEDDTVRALGAVNRRSGRVLEDFHGHDIGGIDGRQRGDGGNLAVSEAAETEVTAGIAAALDDHAVDDVQRFRVGVDGRLTADADGRGGTRRTGGLHRGNTGGAALQGLVQVGDDGPLEVFFLHGYGRAGEVAPLHGTVTHDDDFVEEFGVFFQEDIDAGLIAHLDLLRGIADGREHERSAGLHRDHVVSIQVCDSTVLGAFLHHAGADDRADIVSDGTRDPVLGEQGPRGRKERKHEG